MPNTKISALTAASTPLAGTEVLPIVQSGTNKKVSVADLTAGRAVASAGGTFSDNFVQGTAAKGVNFTANTPAAGMTSQLLNSYEQGTWTPVPTATIPGVTPPIFTSATGTYTRIGREVYITYNILFGVNNTGAGAIQIDGLPFTLSVRGFGSGVESDVVGFNTITNGIASTTFALITKADNTYPGGTSYRLQGDCTYIV